MGTFEFRSIASQITGEGEREGDGVREREREKIDMFNIHGHS